MRVMSSPAALIPQPERDKKRRPAKLDSLLWFCAIRVQKMSRLRFASHVTVDLRLANCCFDHNSLGIPVLLRFCDARSGRSFHPLHRYPGSLARTWRRSFHRCRVASPQAPTPDPESLQAPIAESMRVGPHPRRFDGALGASYSSIPLRHRTEALNPARSSPSL